MRILLGFILALSVSFACDQPHEEVGGYKIGCPVDTSYLYTKKSDGELKEYGQVLKDSFFKEAHLTVLDGNIEGVYFIQTYPNANEMYKNTETVLSSLKKRWGEYREGESSLEIKRYYFLVPESGVISDIEVAQFNLDFTRMLDITYTSRKLKLYRDKISSEEEAERAKILQGF